MGNNSDPPRGDTLGGGGGLPRGGHGSLGLSRRGSPILDDVQLVIMNHKVVN